MIMFALWVYAVEVIQNIGGSLKNISALGPNPCDVDPRNNKIMLWAINLLITSSTIKTMHKTTDIPLMISFVL